MALLVPCWVCGGLGDGYMVVEETVKVLSFQFKFWRDQIHKPENFKTSTELKRECQSVHSFLVILDVISNKPTYIQ